MDPIAQMLTKIRNAQMAGHAEVRFGASKLKFAVAKILEAEGYIKEVTRESEDRKENIRVILKYDRISNTKKIPAITGIRRISHEGQRIYIKSKDVKNVRNKYGTAIISTSQGVMTNYDCRKKGLGGEYICEVW